MNLDHAEEAARRALSTLITTLDAVDVLARAMAGLLADLAHAQKPSPVTISEQRANCRRMLVELSDRRIELTRLLEKSRG